MTQRSKSTEVTQYVLLPIQGTHSHAMTQLGQASKTFNTLLKARLTASSARPVAKAPSTIDIVHSVSPTGAKLALLTDAQLAALRANEPSVRAIPLVYYDLTHSPTKLKASSAAPKKTPTTASVTIAVTDAAGAPIAGAAVYAFTDFEARAFTRVETNAKGEVTIDVSSSHTLDVLAIYPGPIAYWGWADRRVTLKQGAKFVLESVDLAVDDYNTKLYGEPALSVGAGVVVGIIDSGVDGAHPHLKVSESRAFVNSEGDAGDGGPAQADGEHGTHVAGLVASTGRKGSGRRGRSPGVTLNSYRVFPNAGGPASNYDLLRAIEAAVTDGCDLINLSLGTGVPDEAVRDAIKEAFDNGTVCIAAAGNNGRQPLLYPARWSEVLSISAIGYKGAYPARSTDMLNEALPASRLDNAQYAATFANIGPELTATAPGVGIVSTLPGGLYGPLSGTSMACPIATGLLAAALSKDKQILAMPRNRDRAVAIKGKFFSICKTAGFDKEFEGLGLPS